MPIRPGVSSTKITPILNYIHNNLDTDLKIAALAEKLELSSPHFCRLFKQTTGLSPYRYILLQRIELAKQLLASKNLNLSDIALRCGFYDQSHFNLQFRNHTGMTPKDYQEKSSSSIFASEES